MSLTLNNASLKEAATLRVLSFFRGPVEVYGLNTTSLWFITIGDNYAILVLPVSLLEVKNVFNVRPCTLGLSKVLFRGRICIIVGLSIDIFIGITWALRPSNAVFKGLASKEVLDTLAECSFEVCASDYG